ncbi:MAG: cation-translocating P-type ATPase [Candidatus Eisenbacteria bacterium]
MDMKLRVKDLDCMDCARALENTAKTIDGVDDARVSFTFSTLEITLHEGQDRKTVIRSLRRKGYEVIPIDGETPAELRTLRSAVSRRRLLLTCLCGGLLLAALAAHILALSPGIIRLMLVAATAAGIPLTLFRAVSSVRSRSIDMNVLMSVAIVAAAVIGEWEEAGMVAFLFSIAIILEALAMARTRKAIESLMDLSPDKATVRRNGEQVSVDASEVSPGETIVVRPGERIPLEGNVTSGKTSVDESPITGEPMPVTKQPGSQVFAGTLNEEGLIEVSVSKPREESTLARIIHLVEHVEESRAPVERFVDRFARIYTPAVVCAAVLMAVIPSILGLEGQWIYRSIVVLIIACPCALVLATPVAVVSGLTTAARKGILVKGGLHLEQAAGVKVVALDKTGTVTEGRPTVSSVNPFGGIEEEELLRIASSIESASTHPLAGAVMSEARKRGLHFGEPQNATAITGSGMSATVDGVRYHVAKPEFFAGRPGVDGDFIDGLKGVTTVGVGTDTALLGLIQFDDEIRPAAARTLIRLKELGIVRSVLLTGDRKETAKKVAETIGVDEYHADLLPDQKVDLVHKLKADFGSVAMVGDGVNDAPALAASDVGIAMGAAGSDTAIDTADVALMSDDISRLVPLFRLSRRVRAITLENIILAIGIKAAFLILAASGAATMWMAVFADMGASLIVIANALRLLSDRAAGLRDD